jgi:hypothetical protein
MHAVEARGQTRVYRPYGCTYCRILILEYYERACARAGLARNLDLCTYGYLSVAAAEFLFCRFQQRHAAHQALMMKMPNRSQNSNIGGM